MALRRATPFSWSPKGASDTLDGTNNFKGAMQSLQNLVPDPSSAQLWQCRPAAIKLTGFSGFTNPDFVSVLEVFGNFAYGMIASQRFPGHDEPFMFNLVSQTFVPITGVTMANTPTSPPETGPWTPPIMALQGGNLLVTHPGFNFTAGFAFGVLNISNPATPTWTARNTSTNALPALPQFVAVFSGRAWFLVNPPTSQPGAYFTDILSLNMTQATQVLTFDDTETLNCAAGLGLFSQLGGVVQSLIIFKNTANVYQITGDAALQTLARNSLNVATGTNSPLSVTSTPMGLAFLAPDGLRIIDFYARVGQPIGVDGNGINVPFVYSAQPTRAQASSNQNVLRVSVQNGNAVGAPNQEWWFDLSRQVWSGPHTFPASQIAAYNNTFVMCPVGITASLWQSDVAQSSSSTFVENGQQMTFAFTSSMLPDSGQMAYFAMVETSINMQLVSGQTAINVQALDQNQSVLGSFNVIPQGSSTLWGQFNWGQALWGGQLLNLFPRPLEWKTPLVFRRMQLAATGNCFSGFKIGDIFLRYQTLGYMIVDPASNLNPLPPPPPPVPVVVLVTESGAVLTTEGGTPLGPP